MVADGATDKEGERDDAREGRETKMKRRERLREIEVKRQRERERESIPLHSNNCHLLSPFICTNRSAMNAPLWRPGRVFQRRRRLKGSMGDLDKSRRMRALGSHELMRGTKESVARFRASIVARYAFDTFYRFTKNIFNLILHDFIFCSS